MNAWDSHVQRLQDEGRVFAALIVDDRGRVIASSENFLVGVAVCVCVCLCCGY